MSINARPACVFPHCDQLGAPAGASTGRFCAGCGRPLCGPSFGSKTGYRVEAFLGSGYFADVFRALDLGSGLAYAAKVYADDPAKREAWAREIAALRRLAHRRLPALRESFDDAGRLFVVMELVAGASLRDQVTASGPLAADRAIRLGIDVCDALEYVASRGWTYRDLHPRNVHPSTPKGAMLVDLDGARPPGWPPQPSGRIGYRAPELETTRPVSAACDVYSLVGCLYFALTGNDPPPEPGSLPELRGRFSQSPSLTDLLDAGRRADPAQRPTAGALRAALRLLVLPDQGGLRFG